MIRLVDSHCHLDMLEPEARTEAVSRAVRAGVRGMLTIATRLSAAEDVIKLAAEHSPHVMAAVGVHPHRVGENGVPAGWTISTTTARAIYSKKASVAISARPTRPVRRSSCIRAMPIQIR